MIAVYDTSWYENRRPLFPLYSPTGDLGNSKLYTVARCVETSTGIDDVLIFPQSSHTALCVYEIGDMGFGVSLDRGTYHNMCRVGNTLYWTDRRTTKPYKHSLYQRYDPYLHVVAGTPGLNGTPGYYRWDKTTAFPMGRISAGALAMLIAARQTDIDRLSSVTFEYVGQSYSTSQRIDAPFNDKNPYYYIVDTGVDITDGTNTYNVYEAAFDLPSNMVPFAQFGNYVDIRIGFTFSTFTNSTVFAILKGLCALAMPQALI